MGEMRAYNDTINITFQEMLRMTRGPKRLPLGIVVPITVIFALIFLFGVVENVALCREVFINKALRTETKYFHFSQAISHLTLLLIVLPIQVNVYWEQYPWAFGVVFCKFHAFVSEMSLHTSVLAMVAFSIERYLAICHPVYSYTMSGLKRARRIIAVLWIVSLISATPFAMFTSVNYIDFPPGSSQIVPESDFCGMSEYNIPSHWPVYELSCLLFFLIPMFVIIFLYVRIELQKRMTSLGTSVDCTVHGETKQSQARKSIIRMLFAVDIICFLCWVPFHTQRLLSIYGRKSPYCPQINKWLYYITGLCYFPSTVTPILYYLLYIKYRNAFRQSHCGNNQHHTETAF